MKLDLDLSPERLRSLPVQLIDQDDGVIVRRGSTQIKVTGGGATEAVNEILVRAGGAGVTVEEILAAFAQPLHADLSALIQRFRDRSILVPADSDLVPPVTEGPVDIFYWHFGASARHVAAQIERGPLAIVGINAITRQLVRSLLATGAGNFQVVDHPLLRNVSLFDDFGRLRAEDWSDGPSPIAWDEWVESADTLGLLVATSDFGEQQALRDLNEYCIKFRQAFLPVVLRDVIGYVGPLIVPGETACLECLRGRQNSNLDDAARYRLAEAAAFEGQEVAGHHPVMASILGDLAVLELTRYLGGVLPGARAGQLLEVNLLDYRITTRRILKLPRCPVCSPMLVRPSASTLRTVFMPGNPVDP